MQQIRDHESLTIISILPLSQKKALYKYHLRFEYDYAGLGKLFFVGRYKVELFLCFCYSVSRNTLKHVYERNTLGIQAINGFCNIDDCVYFDVEFERHFLTTNTIHRDLCCLNLTILSFQRLVPIEGCKLLLSFRSSWYTFVSFLSFSILPDSNRCLFCKHRKGPKYFTFFIQKKFRQKICCEKQKF